MECNVERMDQVVSKYAPVGSSNYTNFGFKETNCKQNVVYVLDPLYDSDSLRSKHEATDENRMHKRTQWGKQMEFVLSCVGYAVGLGNIVRFPYLCLQNGGGAFLIPYLLYLIMCGMSLFFMETALGQSTGMSTIRLFSMIPFFEGVGWCMVFISAMICVIYSILSGYTIYYLAMSFNWVLPWSHCRNYWNTDQCFSQSDDVNETSAANMYIASSNISQSSGVSKRSAAEEFWRFNVLELSEGIETLGGINWKLLGALTGSWIITYICMSRGIRSAGKVVYLTATLPYVLLTVIIIRGCTLPGSWDGLKFYILPKWSALMRIQVWIAAATQIFYSLGPAWGGLITFASYNQYDYNILRDAMIIPLVCAFTSIYGGVAIYSVIGHQMYLANVTDITWFQAQGPGLAFASYPQAITLLPGAAVWSVLFFLMLLTVGADSQFATMESVVSGLVDQFPKTLGRHRALFTFIVCLLEYLLSLILVTRAGFHYFVLLDSYATTFSVVVIGLLETLTIAYLYGARRLLKDVEYMIGTMHKLTKYWWAFTWLVLVPIMTLVIIVNAALDHITHAAEYQRNFPKWAILLGWSLTGLSLVKLPIMATVAVRRHGCNLRKLFTPDEEWQLHMNGRRTARIWEKKRQQQQQQER